MDQSMKHDVLTSKWTKMRKRIASGDKSSGPTDWFESVLDAFEDRVERILQRVEGEKNDFDWEKIRRRDEIHCDALERCKQIVKEEMEVVE